MLLDLFVDLVNERFVASRTNATQTDFEFFRDNKPYLRLTPLEPNPAGGMVNKFNVVDVTDLSLRVGVGYLNEAGEPVILALQTEWTKDEVNNTFSAPLNLDTTQMRDEFTVNGGELTAIMEIEFSKDGAARMRMQQIVKLKPNLLRSELLEPDAIEVPSLFINTLFAALLNSSTITWTLNGSRISGNVKIDPDGGLEAGPNGIKVKQPEEEEEGEPITMHAPVSIGDVSPNIIPTESFAEEEDNEPGGGYIASASQEATPAWRAFDGVANSINLGWSATSPPAPDPGCVCEPGHEPHIWLAIQFPVGKTITAYELVGSNTPDRTPKNWYLEGSNDGATWTILDTRSNETGWTANQMRRFEVEHDDTTYTRYRLKITANNGNAVTEVDEWRLEDVCETIIAELEGQVLFLRVRLKPGGHVICGPGGLQLDFEPFTLASNEGLVIYQAFPPNVSQEPKYARYLWANTSKNPRTVNVWNATSEEWDEVGVLPDGEGHVITTDGAVPDVGANPRYGFYLWVNQGMSPPTLNVWNPVTNSWISVCSICSIGGGYPGILPPVEYTPPSGAAVPVEVELSVPGFTDGITIYYTTNGTEPFDFSAQYSGPINLTTGTTIRAFARKTGWIDSPKNSASYGAITIPQWLFNVNWKSLASPNKVGGAATHNNAFEDVWNNLTAPTDNTELREVFFADGTFAGAWNNPETKVLMRYSEWAGPGKFALIANGNADAMFGWAMKYQNQPSPPQDHEFGIYLYLTDPYGVFDLWVYGHGGTDPDNSSFYVEDQFGKRANEATQTTSGWNTTLWGEGKQFRLFEDLEKVETDRVGFKYQLFAGALLLINEWNAGLRYFSGFQLRKKNQLPKVRFSSPNGANTPMELAMSCPGFPTAEIRYTTNGSTPTSGSTLYDPENPPTIASAATVKAIALVPSGNNPNNVANSAVNSVTLV